MTTFTPGLREQITTSHGRSWIGCVGGAMALSGWGLEGAIAGRALDVSDPDVGLTMRSTAEVLVWLVVLVLVFIVFSGSES